MIETFNSAKQFLWKRIKKEQSNIRILNNFTIIKCLLKWNNMKCIYISITSIFIYQPSLVIVLYISHLLKVKLWIPIYDCIQIVKTE